MKKRGNSIYSPKKRNSENEIQSPLSHSKRSHSSYEKKNLIDKTYIQNFLLPPCSERNIISPQEERIFGNILSDWDCFRGKKQIIKTVLFFE